LNRRANRLAHSLRGRGVGPETTVALGVERSPEMVIGILGVLKAGGAYVPLDVTQPAERLGYMLRGSGARGLLTQEHLRAGLPAFDGTVIGLDEMTQAGVDTPSAPALEDNPHSGVGPDDLAYVIFTSGSTGQPKGVLVEHRGLTNVISAHNRALEIGPPGRVLQFVSLHFDAARGEIFRALTAGATLCLATPDELLPGPGLIRLLREQGITAASLPPSVLAALPEDEELPALRTVI